MLHEYTVVVASLPLSGFVDSSEEGCLVCPNVPVFQYFLSFLRDTSLSFSRYVLLVPLFRSLLVCTVDLDLPFLVAYSVVDHLGPRFLLEGTYPILGSGGLRPLIDGSVGRRDPGLFYLFFPSTHLGPDVCLFIQWATTMFLHLDQ